MSVEAHRPPLLLPFLAGLMLNFYKSVFIFLMFGLILFAFHVMSSMRFYGGGHTLDWLSLFLSSILAHRYPPPNAGIGTLPVPPLGSEGVEDNLLSQGWCPVERASSACTFLKVPLPGGYIFRLEPVIASRP